MPRVVSFFIAAGDPQRAIEFYRDVFEWDFAGGEIPRGTESFPFWRVRTGDLNEPGIDGVFLPREQPGAVTVCVIEVPSIEQFVERIKDNGGKLMEGPVETPDGDRVAVCQDPQGNLFDILERSESSGAAKA